MKLTLSSSPHQRAPRDTGQIMRLVIYALLPGLLLQAYHFGWGVLIQALLAASAAVAAEAAILWLRGKNIARTLGDYSALLTGLLLAVSLPPLLPWWMTVLGAVFAIAVVKQLYGGLGYNMFNPAMVAYVMLLISFPVAMTMWMPPHALLAGAVSLSDSLSIVFSGFSTSGYDLLQLRSNVDGVTMATPLDAVKTGLTQGLTYSESLQLPIFSGGFAASVGTGWAWVSLAYGLGGLLLLRLKVINWHIPVSLLAGVVLTALILHLANQDHFASPLFHLFNGSALIGAFFIATDPVSASTTNRGRLIFGACIGFWVVIIRTFGGYPDAVAFAVIIMNMAVPLIDYYTRPRTYGHHSHRNAQKGRGQ